MQEKETSAITNIDRLRLKRVLFNNENEFASGREKRYFFQADKNALIVENYSKAQPQ
jgi:hypothetical protein